METNRGGLEGRDTQGTGEREEDWEATSRPLQGSPVPWALTCPSAAQLPSQATAGARAQRLGMLRTMQGVSVPPTLET